jgi:aspartate/methionine/tyrosine aminotransferase
MNDKHNSASNIFSYLVESELNGLSPIQTIMKIAEPRNIIDMGLHPEEVISFGGGWCNHKAPERLRSIYQQIIDDINTFHKSGRYSPIKGDYLCCEQLCHFEKYMFHIADLSTENIIIGHSSTQLFHDVLRVLQNPGEHVCVLDPTYANYHNAVTCALPKSDLLYVPALDIDSWTYLSDPEKSLDILQNYCRQGAKTFVIPVPDNPTSQIPPDSFIKAAREIMQDNHGFLIIDYAYKSLWFDDMPPCFSWSPNEYENLVTIHSNSKWLSSLGRRFGWIEAHPSTIKGLEKIIESSLLSSDTLHGMATTRFLEESIKDQTLKPYIDSIRELYKKTAQVMMNGIETYLGWDYLEPKGGLYTVCPTPNNKNPITFVEELLKHTGVLLIPGIGFGSSMNKGLRISYGPLCYDHDLIDKGLKKVGNYLKK